MHSRFTTFKVWTFIIPQTLLNAPPKHGKCTVVLNFSSSELCTRKGQIFTEQHQHFCMNMQEGHVTSRMHILFSEEKKQSGREHELSLKQCSTPTQADGYNSHYNVKKLFACNIYQVFSLSLNTLMFLCLS